MVVQRILSSKLTCEFAAFFVVADPAKLDGLFAVIADSEDQGLQRQFFQLFYPASLHNFRPVVHD